MKAVCDRLKGAELLNIENFNLNNLNFVRYTLRQENGSIEYSTSFTVGKKGGRNTFSFQSNWLNQIMPVEQFTASAPLPKSYNINGSRNGAQLNLRIENKTSATHGYFEVEEKASETSTIRTKRTIPFSMNANGKSSIRYPMNDVFESTVSMFINGKLQDVVYMTDGVWNIGYDPAKTILKSFQVKNDSTRQLGEDYPVFRNVAVEATTAEFFSVYKVLRGAGVPQHLTAYKTLAFSAKGGTNLRIVLVKNSITNYQNQYSYSMPLASELSSYNISLDDFKSAGTTDKIDANDITTVVFSFETTSGKTVTINTLLSEVAFSKKTAGYLNSQEAAQIYVFLTL